MNNEQKIKGAYKGLCNITSCQSPSDVVYWNRSTQKFYCRSCCVKLNNVNYEGLLYATQDQFGSYKAGDPLVACVTEDEYKKSLLREVGVQNGFHR